VTAPGDVSGHRSRRCGPPASDPASAGARVGGAAPLPAYPCPSSGDRSWPTTGMTPRVGRGTRGGEAANSQGDQAETTNTSPSPQRTLQRKQLSSLSTPVHPRSVEAKMQPGDDRRATPPSNPSWNPPITCGVRLPQPQQPLPQPQQRVRCLLPLSQWEFRLSRARVVMLVYVDHLRVPVIRQWSALERVVGMLLRPAARI